jgi:hypothetical protein
MRGWLSILLLEAAVVAAETPHRLMKAAAAVALAATSQMLGNQN